MTERADNRLVRIAILWERESRAGRRYFSGFMGDCQILMFQGDENTRDTGEIVQTWKLMVRERDPDRRPRQRRDLPIRGQSTWDATRGPTGRTDE
jgi:hypothetical protein